MRLIALCLTLYLMAMPVMVHPEDKAPETTTEEDKFLKELYEGMSPELKRYYGVQEEKKPTKEETVVKPSVEKKQTTIEKKESVQQAHDKGTFEKVLDFLFGSEPQKPVMPTAPAETPQEVERTITAEETIEGLKPLKEIIANAKANSPEIQKAKIEAEIIRRQNTFTPVPTFSVGNDFATGKMLISAGIQLPLEPLFTGKQRERYGQLLIRQKELEVEQKVIDQFTVVKQTKERLEKRKEKVKYAKQLVQIAEEQYKGAVIRLDELIKAKEALWQLEQDTEILEQGLKNEIEKLKSIEYGAR